MARTAAGETKKTVNVTVDLSLLKRARDVRINLSRTLNDALKIAVFNAEAVKWKEENKEGLEELNAISEEHGILSDEYRSF